MTADIRDVTDANQRKASDPRASAWVSANAGTGKTTVLVNRALRLLLEGPAPQDATQKGVAPERILCLTYTKNAAAEMENRLFDTLGAWATMEEPALEAALQHLMGRAPDNGDMQRARRLFATTLEARGGLKIHTIHAFCERLLKRFPLEARVPAGFAVIDEIEQRALLDGAIDAVLDDAADAPDARYGPALAHVIAHAAESSFRTCIDAMLGKREALRRIVDQASDSDRFAEGEELALRQLLGVRPGASEEGLRDDMARVLGDDVLTDATEALATGGPTDRSCADAYRAAREANSREARIAALSQALLTQAGEPRKNVCTKAVREAHPALAEHLADARDRLYALELELTALQICTASGALLDLADAILGSYARAKAARASLDYDDLISRTVSLLTRSDAAAWVLYKLDGGIDHILVDEAQDTSPLQWQVIAALADEFLAGEGARPGTRTLFAVGDEKQSIYAFQGADPAEFGRQGRAVQTRAEAAGLACHRVPLTLSFRSTQAVLDCVDAVFARAQAFEGLSWEDAAVLHHAFRAGQPGLVEIWPVEEPGDRPQSDAFDPLSDSARSQEAVERVVARVADTIAGWLRTGALLESAGRPITPGDVLILVRKREPVTRPMIRALKERGVPVAGADRMCLTEQLAVLDLMSLGDVLLMPDDDLSLATVLKSPLFGLDDDDLFELAHRRPGSLWESLRAQVSAKPAYREASDRLEQWLSRADYQPPYEFYAGVLEEQGMEMRRRMLTRLGPDAADAMDEFLNLALRYDDAAPPSLQGFLDWVRRGEVEVKRDMEQGRDEVRIMTVHGAKGLQANIVILPDTCAAPGGAPSPVRQLARRAAPPGAPDHLVWALPGAGRLEAIDKAGARLRQAEREEYNRLLYVAMTRARDRLYVCGWAGRNRRREGVWYDLVADGAKELVTQARDGPGRALWRHRSGDAMPERRPAEPAQAVPPDPPAWASRPALQEAPPALRITPSALLHERPDGRDSWPDQDVASPLVLAARHRFLRGEIVHALLQYLPAIEPARWDDTARALVARRGAVLTEAERSETVTEALAILRHGELGALFGAGSRAEVPILARLKSPDGRVFEITGQIDRLVVHPDSVLIVDYKTNRPPPETEAEVAPSYVAQLAAYRAALRQLYPDRDIACALLWTAAPRLMRLSQSRLDDHEARIMAETGDRPA